MKLPHQVLGAAFGRVRAPGARTAAPKVKNCRTGATMFEIQYKPVNAWLQPKDKQVCNPQDMVDT